MGVIREAILSEVLPSALAGTTPTKATPRPPKPRREAASAGRILAEAACRVPRPMPSGAGFARELREGLTFPMVEGAAFVEAIRK